jgi:sialidase-1
VAHRRLISISADGATGWSEPRFDDESLEPICIGSIISLQQVGHRIVFGNPGLLERNVPGGAGRYIRHPLLALGSIGRFNA